MDKYIAFSLQNTENMFLAHWSFSTEEVKKKITSDRITREI